MIGGSLDYASFLFPFHSGGLYESLERVFRRALKYCIGQTLDSLWYSICGSGIGPTKLKSEFLTCKFILKLFAIRPNVLVNKLQNLHFAHMDSDYRSDLYERFPLYRAYRFVKDYRLKIGFFSKIPQFYFHMRPPFLFRVDFALSHVVEHISSAAYPQLAFQAYFSQHIEGRCLFFTDASKTDSFPHTSAAYYSPSILVQQKYKLDGYFSIFSVESIAIICAVECILESDIKKASIFTDSRNAVESLSSDVLDKDLSYLILVLRNGLRSASLQDIDTSF